MADPLTGAKTHSFRRPRIFRWCRMKARPAVRVRIALLLLFSSLMFCLAVSEMVLRLFFRAEFSQPDDERSFLYRYDAQLGWFPKANSSRKFTITRPVRVTHNSKGFRDIEPHPD